MDFYNPKPRTAEEKNDALPWCSSEAMSVAASEAQFLDFYSPKPRTAEEKNDALPWFDVLIFLKPYHLPYEVAVNILDCFIEPPKMITHNCMEAFMESGLNTFESVIHGTLDSFVCKQMRILVDVLNSQSHRFVNADSYVWLRWC